MRPALRRIALPALGLLALQLVFAEPASGTSEPGAAFPRHLRTVAGEVLDLKELARHKTLVVITLKATWCPVCQRQLARIREKLPEILRCGVTFLVLSPGPASELRGVRERSGFPYPFVEDVDLKIAESLGLRLGEREIIPSILILKEDLRVGWMQQGRNPGSYGDPALLERINCGSWI